MATIEQGNSRLLELADLLDKADALHRERGEPTYSQDDYTHSCGTPACAHGHACRHEPFLAAGIREDIPFPAWGDTAFFALQPEEDSELFGFLGCGKAEDSVSAANYIRAFVARRSST